MESKFTLVVTTAKEDIVEAWRIRREVFADEQGIPADLDPDGLDESAFHVLCRAGDAIVGTGRLVATGNGKGTLSRIAVRAAYRGQGLGRQIVQTLESVAVDQRLNALSLQPHEHLEEFYQSLGYHTVPGTDSVAGHALITMQKELDVSGKEGAD